MAEVKVFRTWSSPFALRVVWALTLKGVEFESVEEDLTKKSPLLLQYNPVYKKVPVLLHNGKPISESLVILEYIDETWKQNPLMPEGPYERAQARFWAKFCDDKVWPILFGCIVKEGKELEEAVASAMENFKFLEEELKGKIFFGGETVGYLDIAMGTIANMIDRLEGMMPDVKVLDEEKFPLLSAWAQRFFNVPAIKECLPPMDKLVARILTFREAKLTAAAAAK